MTRRRRRTLRTWLQVRTLRVWTWDYRREQTVERTYLRGWRIPGRVYYWLWGD